MAKRKMWNIMVCWAHPACKTLGEAINNPRLVRIQRFCKTKKEADQKLKYYEGLNEKNFVYWIEQAA